MKDLLEDDDMWKMTLNDLSRRHGMESDHINFYEWLFLRATCVAWTIATG